MTVENVWNWRKSSYSGGHGGECVEIADIPGGAAVRDTQNRRLGHLTFENAEWTGLLTALKASTR
ncbi:DUF397 domain-containing protein [Nocardiopsis sp. NRRL B-16309]|uniref:DUF397 domain-containing protein n=1 Tax=Nocardiopsis sp. NRRL B-16309 TaxID=1519494 RepID=UPI0006B06B69|nr:DUF397 domain-containing protein [Nocardiopsis sp. NRRL B-16309]KOX23397.1 hypothetical protein ADL05_02800 [Nocardiopsis sp. NRRL B-16309]